MRRVHWPLSANENPSPHHSTNERSPICNGQKRGPPGPGLGL